MAEPARSPRSRYGTRPVTFADARRMSARLARLVPDGNGRAGDTYAVSHNRRIGTA